MMKSANGSPTFYPLNLPALAADRSRPFAPVASVRDCFLAVIPIGSLARVTRAVCRRMLGGLAGA